MKASKLIVLLIRRKAYIFPHCNSSKFILDTTNQSNRTRMAQTNQIMRIVALSINTSKKAGEIIRNVMSSKQLNIVEKVI